MNPNEIEVSQAGGSPSIKLRRPGTTDDSREEFELTPRKLSLDPHRVAVELVDWARSLGQPHVCHLCDQYPCTCRVNETPEADGDSVRNYKEPTP